MGNTSWPRLRILLAHHAPWNDGAASRHARQLLDNLLAAGHQVRVLLVDRSTHGALACERRVRCDRNDDEADVQGDLPAFAPTDQSAGRVQFEELNDRQFSEYRDVLRDALDEEIDEFDPHLIHAQHAWLLGHLALEAGVPYVLTVWPDEFAALQRDARFRQIAHEAAENAGRIVVCDPHVRQQAIDLFSEVDPERFVLWTATADADGLNVLEELYRAVLVNRFGTQIRP